MQTIRLYILLEVLKVFLVALAALTLLLMLIGVIREAANQGLGPVQIVRLIPYILPDSLRFSVPGTLLFAACSVYGRMSGANEVVAVKSLGISPLRLLWPTFALAMVLSLVAVWLNDVAVSWGTEGVRRVVVNEAAEIIYGILRKRQSYTTSRFSVTVKGVVGRKLISPVFSFQGTDDTPPMMVQADEAELHADADTDTLTITFRNASVDIGGHLSARYPDSLDIAIPLEGASRTARASNSPALLPLRAIPDRIAQQQATIQRHEQEYAAQAAYQMLTGDFAGLTGPEWVTRATVRRNETNYLQRLRTEPYRRWAGGFSCLCFVIVGAPMAIRLRSCDVLTTFFVCFLPILVIYYPLLTYGINSAKNGDLPPYCVWLGNVVLVCWGLWLTRRVLRY